jgi:hypothetical protein
MTQKLDINSLRVGQSVLIQTENTLYRLTRRRGPSQVTLRIIATTTPDNHKSVYFNDWDTKITTGPITVDRSFAFSPSASGGIRVTSFVNSINVIPIPVIILRDDSYSINGEDRMLCKGPYRVRDLRTPPSVRSSVESATPMPEIILKTEGYAITCRNHAHYKGLYTVKDLRTPYQAIDRTQRETVSIVITTPSVDLYRELVAKKLQASMPIVMRDPGDIMFTAEDAEKCAKAYTAWLKKETVRPTKLSELKIGQEATLVSGAYGEPLLEALRDRRVRRIDEQDYIGIVLDGPWKGGRFIRDYCVKDVTPIIKLSKLKVGQEATIVDCVDNPSLTDYNGTRIRKTGKGGLILAGKYSGEVLGLNYNVVNVTAGIPAYSLLSELKVGQEATIVNGVTFDCSEEIKNCRVRRIDGNMRGHVLTGKHAGHLVMSDYYVKDVVTHVKLSSLKFGQEATIVRRIDTPVDNRFDGLRVKKTAHKAVVITTGEHNGMFLFGDYDVTDVKKVTEIKLSDLKEGDQATIVSCIEEPENTHYVDARVQKAFNGAFLVTPSVWYGYALHYDYIVKDVKLAGIKLSSLKEGDEATIVRAIKFPACVQFNGLRVRKTGTEVLILTGEDKGYVLNDEYEVENVKTKAQIEVDKWPKTLSEIAAEWVATAEKRKDAHAAMVKAVEEIFQKEWEFGCVRVCWAYDRYCSFASAAFVMTLVREAKGIPADKEICITSVFDVDSECCTYIQYRVEK